MRNLLFILVAAYFSINTNTAYCMTIDTAPHTKENVDKQAPSIQLTAVDDIARFEGPYQTPNTIQERFRKKLVTATALPTELTNIIADYVSPSIKPDRLRTALAATTLPQELTNLIASYFFYRQPCKTVIYQEKGAQKIIKEPTSYSLHLTHANESVILGYELIGSVEYVSGLIRGCFILQEWAYQQAPKKEIRFAKHHVVTDASVYPTSSVHKYTFGIDIPHDSEWTARESISKFGPTPNSLSSCIIA